MDFSHIIQGELDRISSSKRRSGKYTFIACPFHNERTPSLRVFHDTGHFKCFGCAETGSWNTLAKKMGLQPIGSSAKIIESLDVLPTNMERYDDSLLAQKAAGEELKFRELDSAWVANREFFPDGKWRGFKLDFLTSIGAKFCTVVKFRRHYVYLPIIIQGKTRGYIKAQIVKPTDKDIPSYINSKSNWSLHDGLFPYDAAVDLMKRKGLTTLVLVEGPRDALRLIRMGIPAICIMGTHSWSKRKYRHLEFSGAEHLFLMFDGDKAGKMATKLVRTGQRIKNDGSVEQLAPPLSDSFKVKTIRLWNATVESGSSEDKYDPGNCPVSILRDVRSLLK